MNENGFDVTSAMGVLAKGVAGALGNGWTVDEVRSMRHGFRLNGPNGVALWARNLNDDNAPGQMEVSGIYPDGASRVSDVQRYKIGVSGTRPPTTIARDIARRLLDDVRTETARVVSEIERYAVARAQRHAARDALIALLPGAYTMDERDNDTSTEIRWFPANNDDTGYAKAIRLSYDGSSVQFDIRSMPWAMAEKVAKLLGSA